MPEIHEADLIAAAKLGDRAAMSELFERHYASSLAVARRILHSENEAEDAVQNGYLSAFRNLQSFRGDAAFKTWITRIVTNHCLMRLRQPSHRDSRNSFEAMALSAQRLFVSRELTPEAFTLQQELALALTAAAAGLPKHLCDVFHLHSVSGLSLKQVAAEIGVSLPAAKSRLCRAHARLRESLLPVWARLGAAVGTRPDSKRKSGRAKVLKMPLEAYETVEMPSPGAGIWAYAGNHEGGSGRFAELGAA